MFPTTSFFGFADNTLPLIGGQPRRVYVTNALLPDQDNLNLLLSPFNVLFHDDSFITFHDNSHMLFHNYLYPDINRIFNMPRTVYSGEAEN